MPLDPGSRTQRFWIELGRGAWLILAFWVLAGFQCAKAVTRLLSLRRGDADASLWRARLAGRFLLLLIMLAFAAGVWHYHFNIAPEELQFDNKGYWTETVAADCPQVWANAGWIEQGEKKTPDWGKIHDDPAAVHRMYHRPYAWYAGYSLVNFAILLPSCWIVAVMDLRRRNHELVAAATSIDDLLPGQEDRPLDEATAQRILGELQRVAEHAVDTIGAYGWVLMLVAVAFTIEAFAGYLTAAPMAIGFAFVSVAVLVATALALYPALCHYAELVSRAAKIPLNVDPEPAAAWRARVRGLGLLSLVSSRSGLSRLAVIAAAILGIVTLVFKVIGRS